MRKDIAICIVGDKGMLGRAIWSKLKAAGYTNLISCDLPEVDLTNQVATDLFFKEKRPEYVFFLAAISAGIEYKKKYPVEVMIQNLQMICNVLSCAQKYGCLRLLNVCSALLYPNTAEIPLREDFATHTNLNEIDTPYSLAKAAGFQLCQYYNREYGTDFFTAVPCNFFGPYAPFEGDRAGVVPALIQRIHNAKRESIPEVIVWGTGNACREFLNSIDVADACIFLMEHPTNYPLLNIGRGHEFSIRETAEMIKRVIGYEGQLVFDATKPEGRPHMQLNTERIFAMGWRPQMDLEESIRVTYEWFEENI